MKETIGVRLDGKIIAILRQYAEDEHRTLSNMTAVAATRYVEARIKLLKAKEEQK